MELLLDKKKSEYMRCVSRGSAVCEENTEIIVSDKSPDIARIVRGMGSVFLRDKEARNGKIVAEGTVKGVVLYVAENEKNIRKLDVTMPFFCSAAVDEISAEAKLSVSANLRFFDVREINPRKVAVRAGVEITYCAYEPTVEELCGGVVDAEKFGICTKSGEFSSFRTVILYEKNFSISDDIEFSGDECQMNSVVFGEAKLIPSETKIIGNKSILKGVAEVGYIYTIADGSMHSAKRELPFSQILDIDGMEEEHELDVRLAVTGVGFDTQFDPSGEARYMSVNITALATATVSEKTQETVITDAYSTMYDCKLETETITASKYSGRSEKKVAISESIETGGVKRVVDVSVSLLPATRRREDNGEVISSDALISVVYIGEGDEIHGASRRVSAVCPMEISEGRNYEVSSYVRGCGHSIGHNDEINVRFFVDFNVLETENIRETVVFGISLDTENADEEKKRCGITIKRINETCDVWSLARENKTTCQTLAAANGIEEDGFVPKGKILLIPRSR